MKETVIVFKDALSREIKTFVNPSGHGAKMDLSDFLSLLSEHYGSPVTTLTKKGHLAALNQAAEKAILEMKSKTAAVAAKITGT